MHPDTPQAAVAALVDAMNRNDLDAAIECYEPQAVFAPQPGLLASGTREIREALQAMLALRPTLRTLDHLLLASGDSALYQARWQMSGRAPDGSTVALAGTSADLLRRGGDGRWRIAIDNPWGAQALADPATPA